MTTTRSQRRAAEARRRRQTPPPSWLARNRVIVAASVAVAVLGGAFLASRGAGDTPTPASSADAGETGADFHSLVVDPSGTGRLFAGGHTKVSVSSDGGRSWSRISSLDGADAMGWGFGADAIFVSGHPGLNRSDDGGATFHHTNNALPGTDLHAFGAGKAVLYAAATDAGFIASTDDGASWKVRTPSDARSFFGRIVVDPGDDDHVFVADAQAGVAESSDGGRSWRRLDTGLPAATWLSRSGDGLGVLIASGPAGPVGAARSTDGGATWSPVETPSGATLVEATPDGRLLYAGIHDGTSAVRVKVSRDGGATWTTP